MFTGVRIENFRCFRDLRVPMRPLTVAIGPNNSGKSTFLEALALVANGRVHQTSEQRDLFRGGRGTATGRVAVEGDRRQRRIQRVQLPVNGPSMKSLGVADADGVPVIDHGVPAVLDSLLRRDRARFDGLVKAMAASVPGLHEVDVVVPDPTSRRIDLRMEGGWTTPADESSAGTRFILYFLTLAWHPQPPDVLLIEEPETGLHPERLREVMALLRALTEGSRAPPVQVVLTTHSPILLDCVDAARDQILVFSRQADGSCSARPLDTEQLRPFLADFGLGELWTSRGEKRLVGA